MLTTDEFRDLVRRGWSAAREAVELERDARHALSGLYRPLADESLVARQIRLLGKDFATVLVVVKDGMVRQVASG